MVTKTHFLSLDYVANTTLVEIKRKFWKIKNLKKYDNYKVDFIDMFLNFDIQLMLIFYSLMSRTQITPSCLSVLYAVMML